ncbi:MAG: hypothetical protein J0M04_22020 [Verrucomicrobia bacterium]|nr:hypothetical protein [Verrucomicrobiota bacterium]
MKTQWNSAVSEPALIGRLLTASFARLTAIAMVSGAVASGQTGGIYSFYPTSGGHSAVNAALDGMTVYDSFRGHDSRAYAGEMGLVFADQSSYTGAQTPANTFRADADGPLSGDLGLWGYCVDYSSPWTDSATQSRQFRATTVSDADLLYTQQGVTGYQTGGLFRAAYLIDAFASSVNAQGDTEAAALQTAIWEVLYDGQPDVTQGSFYVRNQLSNSYQVGLMNQVRGLANGYIAAAASENWGVGSFDPDNRVVVWMTTNLQTSAFQSLLTVNPQATPVQYGNPIPEPSAFLLGLVAPLALIRRRRH